MLSLLFGLSNCVSTCSVALAPAIPAQVQCMTLHAGVKFQAIFLSPLDCYHMGPHMTRSQLIHEDDQSSPRSKLNVSNHKFTRSSDKTTQKTSSVATSGHKLSRVAIKSSQLLVFLFATGADFVTL